MSPWNATLGFLSKFVGWSAGVSRSFTILYCCACPTWPLLFSEVLLFIWGTCEKVKYFLQFISNHLTVSISVISCTWFHCICVVIWTLPLLVWGLNLWIDPNEMFFFECCFLKLVIALMFQQFWRSKRGASL